MLRAITLEDETSTVTIRAISDRANNHAREQVVVKIFPVSGSPEFTIALPTFRMLCKAIDALREVER